MATQRSSGTLSGCSHGPCTLARKTLGAPRTQRREWIQRRASKRRVSSGVLATLGSASAAGPAGGGAGGGAAVGRTLATASTLAARWVSNRSCSAPNRSASAFSRLDRPASGALDLEAGRGPGELARPFSEDLGRAALHQLAGRNRQREAQPGPRGRIVASGRQAGDRLADERHAVHQLGRRGRQLRGAAGAAAARRRTPAQRCASSARRSRCRGPPPWRWPDPGSASSRPAPRPPATGSRPPAGRARSRAGPWSAPPAPRGWRRSARSASPRGAPARPRPAARSPPPRAGRRRGR